MVEIFILVNGTLIMSLLVVSAIYHEANTTYFSAGPGESMRVFSLSIDTWTKYFLLQIYIFVIEFTNEFLSEDSIMTTKTTTKLLFRDGVGDGGNSQTCAHVRSTILFAESLRIFRVVFIVLISVSQVDIALLRCAYEMFSVHKRRQLYKENKGIFGRFYSGAYVPLCSDNRDIYQEFELCSFSNSNSEDSDRNSKMDV